MAIRVVANRMVQIDRDTVLSPAVIEHLPPEARKAVGPEGSMLTDALISLQYAVDCWPWLRPPYVPADHVFRDGDDLTARLGCQPPTAATAPTPPPPPPTTWQRVKNFFGVGAKNK